MKNVASLLKKTLLSIFLLASTSVTFAQQNSIITYQTTSGEKSPKGYSSAVSVNLMNCKMLIISGQVSLNSEGNLIGKDNIEQQTTQVFQNIKQLIENAGGTLNDLVKIGIYITNKENIPAFRKIRDRFINLKNPPASTLVEVSSLFRDDLLIEIDATAIIPSKK